MEPRSRFVRKGSFQKLEWFASIVLYDSLFSFQIAEIETEANNLALKAHVSSPVVFAHRNRVLNTDDLIPRFGLKTEVK